MHIMKVKGNSYGKLKAEALREKDENGNYIFHSRVGTIDESKTHLNFSTVNHQTPEANELNGYIKSIGVKRKIDPDAVKGISLICDMSKEQIEEYENLDDESKQVEFAKKYFNDFTDGIKDFYSIKDEDILYAQVHLDEGHPHMHLCFAPTIEVTKEYKDGHQETYKKLCAKELNNKGAYQTLHPAMQIYMNDKGWQGTLFYGDDVVRDDDFITCKAKKIREAERQVRKQERINCSNEAKNKRVAKENEARARELDERENALNDRERALEDEKRESYRQGYKKGVEDERKRQKAKQEIMQKAKDIERIEQSQSQYQSKAVKDIMSKW